MFSLLYFLYRNLVLVYYNKILLMIICYLYVLGAAITKDARSSNQLHRRSLFETLEDSTEIW